MGYWRVMDDWYEGLVDEIALWIDRNLKDFIRCKCRDFHQASAFTKLSPKGAISQNLGFGWEKLFQRHEFINTHMISKKRCKCEARKDEVTRWVEMKMHMKWRRLAPSTTGGEDETFCLASFVAIWNTLIGGVGAWSWIIQLQKQWISFFSSARLSLWSALRHASRSWDWTTGKGKLWKYDSAYRISMTK